MDESTLIFQAHIFARSSMPRCGAPSGMKEDILERDRDQSENGRLGYEHEREPEAVSRYLFAPPVVALFHKHGEASNLTGRLPPGR
jgi:hypothetical protein